MFSSLLKGLIFDFYSKQAIDATKMNKMYPQRPQAEVYQNSEYNPNPNRDNNFFVPRPNPIQKPITKPVTDVQIVNLSARKLNNTEINLLEKGLKFTPTPSNSKTQELTKDILEFIRKVRLVEYFDGIKDNDQSLVRNKTNFVPPQGREELLESCVNSTINIPLVPTEK